MDPDVKVSATYQNNVTDTSPISTASTQSHHSAMSTQSRSPYGAPSVSSKSSRCPPDVVKLVMGLRTAANTMGTTLGYIFRKLDKTRTGSLDIDEFRLALAR